MHGLCYASGPKRCIYIPLSSYFSNTIKLKCYYNEVSAQLQVFSCIQSTLAIDSACTLLIRKTNTMQGYGVDNFFDVGGLTSLHASVHMHLLMILHVHIQCITLRDDLFRGILKLQQNSFYFLCCHYHTTLLVLSKICGGGALAPLIYTLAMYYTYTYYIHILSWIT